MQTLENGSLSIRQTSKEHEGLYLCEADNGLEPALVKALTLLVHAPATLTDNDIQLVQPASASVTTSEQSSELASTKQQQQSQTQLVKWARVMQNSSQLRLVCQPHGDSPLTLDWLKDGELIHSSTHLSSSSHPSAVAAAAAAAAAVASSAFSVGAVQPASDSASAASSSTNGELLVHRGPASANYQVTTSARRRPSSAHAQSQSSQQQQQSTLSQLDSELVLVHNAIRASDAGQFVCVARNAHGSSERKLHLIVQEPPEPPEVIEVAHVGSRSVNLRWQPPTFDGHSAITKYIVEYKRLPAAGK